MTIGNLYLPRTTRNYIIITMYTRSSGTARAAGADTKTRALVEHESNRVLQCASRIWSARSCVRCLVSFAALEPVYRRRLVTPASPEKTIFEKLPPPPLADCRSRFPPLGILCADRRPLQRARVSRCSVSIIPSPIHPGVQQS